MTEIQTNILFRFLNRISSDLSKDIPKGGISIPLSDEKETRLNPEQQKMLEEIINQKADKESTLEVSVSKEKLEEVLKRIRKEREQ